MLLGPDGRMIISGGARFANDSPAVFFVWTRCYRVEFAATYRPYLSLECYVRVLLLGSTHEST